MNIYKNAIKSLIPKPVISQIKSWLIPKHFIEFSGGWSDPVQFNEDGMATAHNADFLKSKKFIEAYQAGLATLSWGSVNRSGIRWRVFNACTLSKYAMRIPGDFVECGTNRGGTATAVIHYNDFQKSGKSFFLLDTFSGFDPSILSTKEKQNVKEYQLRYSDCYEDVKAHFQFQSFVKIIKGSVPSTLPQVTAEKVSFLHLDMNCSMPERAAIEYFWDKITPGGVVLLDDYAWVGHEEQKNTLDEFVATKGLEVIGMATGQGLILKPYY